MITPHILQNESPTDELALLTVGEKKAGKSWLAATAPGTVLFFDFDQRLAALRQHPNVKNIYGLTFADPTNTDLVPTAMNELLTVLGRLEKSPLLCDIHATFKGIAKPVDTLVFDSIQTISDSAKNYVCYFGGNETEGIARVFSIGQHKFRVPRTFTAWGGEMEMVTGAILQARALLHCKKCWKSVTFRKGPQGLDEVQHTDPNIKDHPPEPRAMNVIVNLHETPEEDPRSTDENPIFTGKIVVYPVRYHRLLVYFNEVWRLTRNTGKIPTVTCDPDGRFIQAATALGINKIEGAPDIQAILRLASLNRIKQTTTQTPLLKG